MQHTDLPAPTDSTDAAQDSSNTAIREDRLWHDNGWTARVVKNEDDDGWAVEMFKDGEPEPALVGPWTMGRDRGTPSRSTSPLSTPWSRRRPRCCSATRNRHTQPCTSA